MDSNNILELTGIITSGEYKGEDFGFTIDDKWCREVTINGKDFRLCTKLTVVMEPGAEVTFTMAGIPSHKGELEHGCRADHIKSDQNE